MKRLLICLLLLLPFSVDATVRNSDGSRADTQTQVDLCPTSGPPDTVQLPSGTFQWSVAAVDTSGRSVIIQGNTTTDPVNKTAVDNTILLNDYASDTGGFFYVNGSDVLTPRLTGITFRDGTGVTLDSAVSMSNSVAITYAGFVEARIDHCHFDHQVNCRRSISASVVTGVIDHCIFNGPATGTMQAVHITNGYHGASSNGAGDGAWADYPWYGTRKFLFLEDNAFINNRPTIETTNCIDGDLGGRWVFRHNHFYDITTQSHGTENRVRGVRAMEIYDNDYHFSRTFSGLGGMRTGSALFHDNTLTGSAPDSGILMIDLRLSNRFDDTQSFGGASGTNPWDINDVTNGTVSSGQVLTTNYTSPITFHNGAFNYTGVTNGLYLSGTVAAGSDNTHVIVSPDPGWTTNMWKGFAIKRVSDRLINQVFSNTSNTLVMFGYQNSGSISNPDWQTGDQFELRRPAITIDQPGRGKCDLITGGYNDGGATLNGVTGTARWPNQAQEPVISWSNTIPDISPASSQSDPANFVYVEGRDYYTNSSSATAISIYSASLNGIDYTGPYMYPHPLVGIASATRKILRLVQP